MAQRSVNWPKRSRFARLHPPDLLMGTVQMQRPALALRGTGDEPVIVEAGGLTVFLKLEPRAGEPVCSASLQATASSPDRRWFRSGKTALRSTAEVDDLGSFRCGDRAPAV